MQRFGLRSRCSLCTALQRRRAIVRPQPRREMRPATATERRSKGARATHFLQKDTDANIVVKSGTYGFSSIHGHQYYFFIFFGIL